LLTQDRQVSKMRIEAEVGVVSGECAEFCHECSGKDGIARGKKGKILGSFFLIDHRINPFCFSTAIGNGHPE
jgi:hypothetical protein